MCNIIDLARERTVSVIIRINNVKPLDDYVLLVAFDDGKVVEYDVKDDINTLPGYDDLKNITGLWQQV